MVHLLDRDFCWKELRPADYPLPSSALFQFSFRPLPSFGLLIIIFQFLCLLLNFLLKRTLACWVSSSRFQLVDYPLRASHSQIILFQVLCGSMFSIIRAQFYLFNLEEYEVPINNCSLDAHDFSNKLKKKNIS